MENDTGLPLTTTKDQFVFDDKFHTHFCCVCHQKIELSIILERTEYNNFKEIEVGQSAHLECYIERCVQRAIDRNR